MSKSTTICAPAELKRPAVRVELVREVLIPDHAAWAKGFVCGFVAAALVAGGLVGWLWRF